MQIFDYHEFTKNITKVFDIALIEEVIVNSEDGYSYKLLPISNAGKSPLEDIPCIEADITTQGIVELLRECRAGI